jgi:hypothetical protein
LQRSPLHRRTTLKPISVKRTAANRERKRAQRAAWGRPPWECWLRGLAGEWRFSTGYTLVIPPCKGPVHGHEVAKPRSLYLTDVQFQVPLCDRHNGWCENAPSDARMLGLRV